MLNDMTYSSNDYLRGRRAQKRCGLCEHHPILCDGRCLYCGARSPPLLSGDMQSTEGEVIAQRPAPPEMEAPVLSEKMNEPTMPAGSICGA